MKKLLLLSALLIFACSSDDSNDDNNDDNNQFSGENISKIEIKILNSSQSDCLDNYITSYGSETEYNFYYNNGEVTSATLNNSRFSCETNEVLLDSYEIFQSQLSNLYDNLQYQNEQLVYISWGDDNNNNYNLEWTDGNLTKYYKTNQECCYYTIVEYSDYSNNNKYEFGISFFEGEYDLINGMFKDEFRGVTSTNLPSSVTYIQRREDGTLEYDDLDLFYGYEFNNEGNPVKFLVDSFFSNYSPNSVNEIINQYQYTYQVEITYTN